MKRYVRLLSIMLACLLLVSCKGKKTEPQNVHTHKFGEWMTIQAPTCESEGKMVRYCDCGEKQEETILRKEHSYNENGVCSICGGVKSDVTSTSEIITETPVATDDFTIEPTDTIIPTESATLIPVVTSIPTEIPTVKPTQTPKPRVTSAPTIPAGCTICSHCNGTGTEDKTVKCPECHGNGREITGQELCPECNGTRKMTVPCSNCSGTGMSAYMSGGSMVYNVCSSCSGSGKKR